MENIFCAVLHMRAANQNPEIVLDKCTLSWTILKNFGLV